MLSQDLFQLVGVGFRLIGGGPAVGDVAPHAQDTVARCLGGTQVFRTQTCFVIEDTIAEALAGLIGLERIAEVRALVHERRRSQSEEDPQTDFG